MLFGGLWPFLCSQGLLLAKMEASGVEISHMGVKNALSGTNACQPVFYLADNPRDSPRDDPADIIAWRDAAASASAMARARSSADGYAGQSG